MSLQNTPVGIRVDIPMARVTGSTFLSTMNMMVPIKQENRRTLRLIEKEFPDFGTTEVRHAFNILLASICHHWEDLCLTNDAFTQFIVNYAAEKKVSISVLESYIWKTAPNFFEFSNQAFDLFQSRYRRLRTSQDVMDAMVEYLGITIEVHGDRVVSFDRGMIHVWIPEKSLSGYFVT